MYFFINPFGSVLNASVSGPDWMVNTKGSEPDWRSEPDWHFTAERGMEKIGVSPVVSDRLNRVSPYLRANFLRAPQPRRSTRKSLWNCSHASTERGGYSF